MEKENSKESQVRLMMNELDDIVKAWKEAEIPSLEAFTVLMLKALEFVKKDDDRRAAIMRVINGYFDNYDTSEDGYD